MNIQTLKEILSNFYAQYGNERVGFVMADDTIVEVANNAADPENGFEVSPEDVIFYIEEKGAVGIWHTHPDKNSNLSSEDYPSFLAYKDMTHFIVGNDGVRAYRYSEERKALLQVK